MSTYLPDEELQPKGALWWTFKRQTPVGHLLVVLSGLGVWMGTFALHLSLVGGGIELAAAAGPEALEARQAGIPVATAACWLWFSFAIVVGKGGPMLNVTLYPTGALVFGPYLTAMAAVGHLPPEMFTTASPTSGRFIALGIGFFAPGFLLSVAFLGVFLGVKTYLTGAMDAWAAKHMPDEWHELQAKIDAREAAHS